MKRTGAILNVVNGLSCFICIIHRTIFKENNMWSSFIGFNPDNTKGIEGLFPILLWPEQNRWFPLALPLDVEVLIKFTVYFIS